jgi:hypothetical protein
MLILRDPDEVSTIADKGIRELVSQRFLDIAADDEYDDEIHGYFIVLEAGDSVAVLEAETSCPILHNHRVTIRYGEPSYIPCFEIIEEHATCFEMVFVLNEGGYGVVIFIPKEAGIDPVLLSLCQSYAIPAPELA